ncbi:TPA: 30S ribosomal protein S16 [Candidatus Bipolaricaulota bacterium]|nr:30S ribosomal protein S16 [Candidatus Bipolaricaulota bacterium]
MAVKIRLKRIGRRHQPSYRIVVVEEAKPRGGAVVEDLGFFNPLEDRLEVDKARALEWLLRGAKPSETARSLLSRLGVMEEWHKTRTRSAGPKVQGSQVQEGSQNR